MQPHVSTSTVELNLSAYSVWQTSVRLAFVTEHAPTPALPAVEELFTQAEAMSRRLLNLGDGRVGDHHYAALAFDATDAVAFSC
jgi:hypothetical protein